ncbi:MAG: OmpA family protein [Chlorobi bacterium]|nr:OmpA family protein [Chlorobiota bacterium]
MQRIFLLFGIGCLLLPFQSKSQQPLPLERELLGLSIRGIWTNLQHYPQFSSLPGTIDCGQYIKGNGTWLAGALSLEYPLHPQLAIGLSAAYIPRGGRLLTQDDSEPAFDSTTGNVVDVVTENSLDVRLAYLEFTPTIWWIPFSLGRSTFRVDGGIRIGIPIHGSLQQERRILSPENAVFISTQQRTINWTGGFQTIQGLTRPIIGASVGLEHLLPIGSRIHLLQRVGYDYIFTPPVEKVSWTIGGVRLELGVRISLEKSEEKPAIPSQPVPVLPPDTLKPPIPELSPLPSPTVALSLLRFEGRIDEGTELVATTPLVNAVFFDQNSAEIPSRYAKNPTDTISTDDPVLAHRNILLVVASILRRSPQASVVLEGACAGDYEGNDTLLARRRAEAVAYALQNLGVEPSRIRIRSTRLPRIPSNMDYPEGRAENQRVDITIAGAPILEYVSKQTFANLAGVVYYRIEGTAIDDVEIPVRITGSDVQTVNGPGEYAASVLVRLDPERRVSSFPLVGEAEVAGTGIRSRDSLVVALDQLPRRRVELATNRFEAILRFDYNSSQLSMENRELLQQLIERISPGTTIEIGGSADILGDVARNRKLAEERARATEEFLRSQAGSKNITIVARGIERRFRDDTPEGRFLNRSIRVTLR